MTKSSLENAPDDIKLAVDLIYLLDSNQVDPAVALKALDIVKTDLLNRYGDLLVNAKNTDHKKSDI